MVQKDVYNCAAVVRWFRKWRVVLLEKKVLLSTDCAKLSEWQHKNHPNPVEGNEPKSKRN